MKKTVGNVAKAYALLDKASYKEMEKGARARLFCAMNRMEKIASDFAKFRKDVQIRLLPPEHEAISKAIGEFQAMNPEQKASAIKEKKYRDALEADAKFAGELEGCLAEEAQREVDLDFAPFTADDADSLIDANEWTVGQAMLVSNILCGQEESKPKGKKK